MKPCPFCAGEAEHVELDEPQDSPNNGGEVIQCLGCGASTAVVFPVKSSALEHLKMLWDRRLDTLDTTEPKPDEPNCEGCRLGWERLIPAGEGAFHCAPDGEAHPCYDRSDEPTICEGCRQGWRIDDTFPTRQHRVPLGAERHYIACIADRSGEGD